MMRIALGARLVARGGRRRRALTLARAIIEVRSHSANVRPAVFTDALTIAQPVLRATC